MPENALKRVETETGNWQDSGVCLQQLFIAVLINKKSHGKWPNNIVLRGCAARRRGNHFPQSLWRAILRQKHLSSKEIRELHAGWQQVTPLNFSPSSLRLKPDRLLDKSPMGYKANYNYYQLL